MKLILSIEIGVNSSKVGLVNQYGDLQARFFIEHNKAKLLENLHSEIVEGLEAIGVNYEEEIEKIAIATVGYVDHMLGIVRYSANLEWNNLNLKEKAEELFKKPIFVLNDANASALGEFWVGVAKQYDSIVFYFIDSGIGGAVILDGKLMPGARGYAGEFGHGGGWFQSKYNCKCGLKGCIEPMSSVTGIETFFTDTFKENKKHPAAIYFKDLEVINLKSIFEIYEIENHPLEIKELLTQALEPLIMHMATMVNALDPEALIIAGGLTILGEALLEIINENIKKYTIDTSEEELSIEIAELGNDSAMVGSAYYALNDWKIF
ncbi:ROK family protein [Spiroplasma taiwanense]|uniref:Glucokinase n=1 Tax=Spiroplasma taiwanense CT-1 TaxID=1276220 RepID=S5LU75_9MOLU|nr:ROK family protein [Spiroplasma taiwanense]AGR41304.1 glucokinase [Spiroplasma taiwanense CT-1]